MEKGEHSSQSRQCVPKPGAWEGCVCVCTPWDTVGMVISEFLPWHLVLLRGILPPEQELFNTQKGAGKTETTKCQNGSSLACSLSLPSLSILLHLFPYFVRRKTHAC